MEPSQVKEPQVTKSRIKDDKKCWRPLKAEPEQSGWAIWDYHRDDQVRGIKRRRSVTSSDAIGKDKNETRKIGKYL